MLKSMRRSGARTRGWFLILIVFVVTAVAAVVLSGRADGVISVLKREGTAGVISRIRSRLKDEVPNIVWHRSEPVEQAFRSQSLEDIWVNSLASTTDAFLVVRNDQIVFEEYGKGHHANQRFGVSAMAKTITMSVILMLAIDDGLIRLNDLLSDYLPEWRDDHLKSKIRVRHIVTHSSGMADVDFSSDELSGWQQQYYAQREDRFRLAIDVAPILSNPGEHFRYSGVAFYPLAYVLAKLYETESHTNLRQLLSDRIMSPLGIPKEAWDISYGDEYEVDGTTMYALGSGGAYSPRAIARIGQLLLNGGRWKQQQLLPADMIDEMLSYGGLRDEDQARVRHPASGGLAIWSNCNGYWPSLPKDASLALGGPHNFMLIVPSLSLVVVRLGKALPRSEQDQEHWTVLDDAVFKRLIGGITDASADTAAGPCYREQGQLH